MNGMIKRVNDKKEAKRGDSPAFRAMANPRVRLTAGLVVMLFSVYLFIAMAGFFFTGGADQSLVDVETGEIVRNGEVTAENPGRKFGAFLADALINRSFGVASFIFCYLLFLCGLRTAGFRVRRFGRKLAVGVVTAVWVSLFLGFVFSFIPTGYVFPGGAHGYFVCEWLNSFIGGVGTFLLLVALFAAILFFGFDGSYNKCAAWFRSQRERRAARQEAREEAKRRAEERKKAKEEARLEAIREEAERLAEEEEERNSGEEPARGEVEEEVAGEEETPAGEEEDREEEEPKEEPAPETPEVKAGEVEITVTNNKPEEEVTANLVPDTEYDPTLELSHYQYPTLDLLEEHSTGLPKVTQEELESNKNTIVETLRNYKIEITKIKATIGPTVTLYEIVPAPGIKISKIKSLEDDIALSLAALGIRIIAPIPGAGTVGIEVPNRNPEIVSMRGLIASKKFQESKYALPVALGRTISNEPYTFDLAKMPHLLVAGATGQGKSVGLNAIITSLLYKKHPSQLKFVMVDPKKVELSIYSVIERHFLAKLPDAEKAIITENDKVVATLNSLCIEMDNRYRLLEQAHVRNIKEYNEKFVKRVLNPEKGHRYLPYIVVVVDEFADLIMTAGKEVETPIARIAQLARAVGIHMIIATQRPSTNIITGVIKANFPARIAFKVASMIDSRTILDSPGANQLIGRGDMLISKDSEMVRVQCAFVDTPEVEAITGFIAEQQGYPEAYLLPDYQADSEGGGANEASLGEKDPLFDEAARLVVSTQQGSTSSIQRRFSIGYNRAGRIMDQLEAAGIVGPFTGSKARDVLVADEYTLEKML